MSTPFLALIAVARLVVAAPTEGVFVLPADPGSESLTPAIEQYAQGASNAFPGFRGARTQELFAPAVDPEAAAAVQRGETALRAAQHAFDQRKDDDTERQLKTAMRELGKGVANMKDCAQLCDATALMAASLERRGDIEGAKAELLNLLSMKPGYTLTGPRFRTSLLKLLTAVREGPDASKRSSMNITTKPAGAHVYLDGTLLGDSPVQVPAVSLGKHILRTEHAGCQVSGRVFSIGQDDQDLAVTLDPLPEYRAFQGDASKMIAEVAARQMPVVTQWGKKLGLKHILLGVLKSSESGAFELDIAFADMATSRRFAVRKMTFHDDAYGQLKLEVEHTVTALINETRGGGGGRGPVSDDPLDRRSGAEGWSAEDRGGKAKDTDKRQNSSGDPLNKRSGTEGW